jgi:hypothetical protein
LRRAEFAHVVPIDQVDVLILARSYSQTPCAAASVQEIEQHEGAAGTEILVGVALGDRVKHCEVVSYLSVLLAVESLTKALP